MTVSVRTSVPAMNATPRVTARAVAKSLSLWAMSPLTVVNSIGGHSPNSFMRSSTRAAVGCSISSTMRPSARKTIRSA